LIDPKITHRLDINLLIRGRPFDPLLRHNTQATAKHPSGAQSTPKWRYQYQYLLYAIWMCFKIQTEPKSKQLNLINAATWLT
jgi:hypothetical protein